ncbi:FAD-binding and (Fe-S)-binding domain-containing protein [Thalassotalea sp. PS06]|uniref:D-2-hydroxyglutarate dehydrogenase YdiJ n=1 Tax=Thalassotalea sp. PS06 TaxID=2594005 RepID=UPI001163FEBA|nr:FAD-binding and (Fe-S)-binding domain-containing protein [Thalassotalea sp. PS06]QDP01255.1 FAD-binding oxidoreductase [Thalassotalea sp. PS06]
MLPRLDVDDLVSPLYQKYLQTLKSSGYRGDISCQYSARLAVATDNSVYQQIPQAVLHPKTVDDIAILTSLAGLEKFHEIQFSARGGGTGTNGQSLTPGIVVDLSRYMNRILELNIEERWVRVQAGVVKDQLNEFLKPHGFFFSPDLSTSNRATIGGMVNTDASGQGSLVYGKTSDHVLGLKSILADGTELTTGAIPIEQAEEKATLDSTEGRLYKTALASCGDNRDKILEKFPRLNRFLTGYDLENVFDPSITQFDLGRLITGSEGSLAIVAEAKLNITEIPKVRALVNIKYDSFESALRHSPDLVEAKALSVETIDSRVLNLAKQDIVWHSVQDLITDVPGKEMDGLNLVEYTGFELEDVEQKIAALEKNLDGKAAKDKGVIGYQVTYDLASISRLYAMRKKAVGLLGNAKGQAKPLAFAEDTAVPPENLADFIMEFRDLLDENNLDYGMFGHVDAGVLHVRPALDMCDPKQEEILRDISDKVVALTAKYGGLMWGEHGKGYRSEYGPEFFGDELFLELRKIKTAFDPLNKMNPGKICTPLEREDRLVSVDDKKRGGFDRQIPIQVREDFPSVMNCNGNGLCFNFDSKSPMCPSSKITSDRRHSPKGRAGLMREWLRLLSQKGVDLDKLQKGKQGFSVKAMALKTANTLRFKAGEYDYSHEVMEAMSGCLACKACASQCPVKVDVPDFRARFIDHYYGRYLRPVKDHFVAHIETLAPKMAKFPRTVNMSINNPVFSWVSRKFLGYEDTPMLSVPSLEQQVDDEGFESFDLYALQQLNDEDKARTVLVVQDPFTSFYDANVVADFMRLVKKLGFRPVLLPFKPNGKPQHVKGFLDKFAKTAADSAEFLNELHRLNMPMIGMDASLVLCYRDEYNQVLGDNRGDFNVLLSHEWLFNVKDKLGEIAASTNPGTFKLFAHCTEKTALAKSEGQWQEIFAIFGLKLQAMSVGCCGMAGTYGHETQNQENSKGLFELSWQTPLKQNPTELMLATGFSCRSQVKRYTDKRLQHPVQALLKHIS